jgi:hypothetical protein
LVLFWFDVLAKETVRSASKIRPDQNTMRMGVHHDPDQYSLDGGVCDFCEYQRFAVVLSLNLREHYSPDRHNRISRDGALLLTSAPYLW